MSGSTLKFNWIKIILKKIAVTVLCYSLKNIFVFVKTV